MGQATSRTEALKTIPYDDLEIVGFNETVKEVPCARVSPVVRHIPTDDFFPLLTATGEADTWWTKADVESLRVENHVTLLPESERIPAFPSAMMVYASSEFMAATESKSQTSFNKEKLHTWTLPHKGSETMLICASSKTIEDLMNDWAERLMSKTTRLLIKFFAHNDSGLDKEAEQSRKDAEELARMARSAAIDRALRSKVLLRLGISLIHSDTPERWGNLRAMVLRNFPGWKSETLDEQLTDLVKSLRMQARGESETIKTNGTDDNHKEDIIERVISIVKIDDEETRRGMAQVYTRKHRELHPVNDTILSRIKETLVRQGAHSNPWIYLEDRELLLALAGEEALYHPEVFKVLPSHRPAINLVGFLRKKKGELLLSGVDDLRDAVSLASKLKTPLDPLSKYIRSRLSEPTKKLLEQYQSSRQPSEELKELLVDEFNNLINGTSLYEDKRFTNVRLNEDTQELIGQTLQGPELLRLNRMLLEDAYPQEIATHRSAVAARVQMAAAGI